jgi:hypothetical protein
MLYDLCACLYKRCKQVRCWHVLENNARLATPTNAVRVPRYPSIAIPRVVPKNLRHLSPPIAQTLTERTGRHDERKYCPW